jgi:hypothetical protein
MALPSDEVGGLMPSDVETMFEQIEKTEAARTRSITKSSFLVSSMQ